MSAWQQINARWQSLQGRERRLIGTATALVGLALVWWVALAPALQILRSAPAQHALLDGQLMTLRTLAGEAAWLKAQPRLGYDDAVRALETSVKLRLGATGQLSVIGERATVTLKGTSPEALAQWLTQARSNARALPADARLTRVGTGWDGTLVLSLPAR